MWFSFLNTKKTPYTTIVNQQFECFLAVVYIKALRWFPYQHKALIHLTWCWYTLPTAVVEGHKVKCWRINDCRSRGRPTNINL